MIYLGKVLCERRTLASLTSHQYKAFFRRQRESLGIESGFLGAYFGLLHHTQSRAARQDGYCKRLELKFMQNVQWNILYSFSASSSHPEFAVCVIGLYLVSCYLTPTVTRPTQRKVSVYVSLRISRLTVITGCTVAQHFCKSDQPFQWETPKFDPSYFPNLLIFPHQNLHR